MEKLVVRMSVRDTIVKKLQQATCDKTELNKQVLRWQKSLKEIGKVIDGSNKTKK